jgi:hypothetical protein
MESSQALERWHEFFVLVGTAGATLVALLFVAVSLGAGFLSDERAAATRAFYSPVVVHFTAVFFLAAIALVPAHRAAFFVVMICACALIGAAVSLFVTVQLLRHDWTRYTQDHLAYALLPTIAYLALLVSAWLMGNGSDIAVDVLAGALLLLLVINVRNAWDLTLSMIRHQARTKRKK